MNSKTVISKYHWLLFSICFLGTAFAGVVSTLMSVYLPDVVKELQVEQEELNNISAYINSIFLFGASAGGLLAGVISDKAGRKKAVIFSIACYSAFAVLTAFMNSWQLVIVCRFFSGVGLGAILVTATVLLTEEWPDSTKSIFLGILSIAIPVGIFSAGIIEYFVSSWRQAFLVQLIPLLLAAISVFLLRESVVWEEHQNRLNQTNSAIATSLFVSDGKNLFIGSVIFGTMLIGLWAVFLWLPTWMHEISASDHAQKERGLSMMLLGIGGLTGGFISGWFVNYAGARKALLLCFAVCSIASFLLFKTNSTVSFALYAEIALIAFFFGISQGVLSVYIPALFPVQFRGTATGFCFNSGRILTAIAVLFVGMLVTTLGGIGNSLFTFSFVFLIGFIICFLSKRN